MTSVIDISFGINQGYLFTLRKYLKQNIVFEHLSSRTQKLVTFLSSGSKMARVDLNKNKNAILEAHKEVSNPNGKNNWYVTLKFDQFSTTATVQFVEKYSNILTCKVTSWFSTFREKVLIGPSSNIQLQHVSTNDMKVI